MFKTWFIDALGHALHMAHGGQPHCAMPGVWVNAVNTRGPCSTWLTDASSIVLDMCQ